MKTCKNCQANFEVTAEDLAFYDKISPVIAGVKYNVPAPTFCPDCRYLRRLSFRNERHLYHRKSSLSGRQMISIYHAEVEFPVYSYEEWYSDVWDGLDYGQEFVFNRSFFEQFAELQKKVPKMALHNLRTENSPYVNHCWSTKNSHMCFDMGEVEDALYCYATNKSKSIVDSSFTRESSFCYDLVGCVNCYGSVGLRDCQGTSDSYFSFDCNGCSNVAFSYNLRNKRNYIFNKEVSKEEFANFVDKFKRGSREYYDLCLKIFRDEVLLKAIHRSNHIINSENCLGNYILNCSNAKYCFDVEKGHDVKFCTRIEEQTVDCYDVDNAFSELCYEASSLIGRELYFGVLALYSDYCFYYSSLDNCKNCFGCIGLKNKQYCILNKQYSKEQYFELVPKIIAHMQKTGEWGEFFPFELSPIAYNESAAQDILSLSEEEILSRGLKFRGQEHYSFNTSYSYKIPDSIRDVSDDILYQILNCENCSKGFKIIQTEINFYREFGIPIPKNCLNCRYLNRRKSRLPSKLYNRNCQKCQIEILTPYAPDRPETVYCETCYLNATYN